MEDEYKTREQLIKELAELRQQSADFKSSETDLRLQIEIMRNMAEGVILIRVSDGAIVYTNPKFEEMFGYGLGELIGKNISIVNAPNDKNPEEVAAEIQKCLRENNVWQGEVYNIKKDGTPFCCYANVSTFNHHYHGEVWVDVHTDITERKKAEESLRESEATIRALMDSPVDYVLLLNPHGIILDINKTGAQIVGRRVDELIGMCVYDLLLPELANNRQARIDEVLRSGVPIRFEDERAGRWYDHSIHPIFDTKGKVAKIAIIARNITERKQTEEELKKYREHLEELVEQRTTELKKTNEELQLEIAERKRAEEALRVSEEKYRLVADFTYDWEDWLDPSGKYIYVSPSCEWITGYHRDDFLDPDLLIKITHPDDRELVREHFREVLSGGVEIQHMDFRIITLSGQMRWISHYCQPVYGKDGSFLGRRSSNRDITERKKAEQNLQQLTDELKRYNVELQRVNDKLKAEIQIRERMQKALELSEERYKRMVGAVTAYTYSVQFSRGHAIYTEHSTGCLPITGYSPDEFKSDPNLWHSMIYPDDKIMVENIIKEILAGHKAPTIEHRIIRRDGTVIWIRNTMVPYYNGDGALIRYDGLIEDISDRKQAEEELKRMSDELARSNADLQQFASIASHDLQEPLHVIAGFVKLLEKRYKDKLDTKAQEIIGFTIEGVKKMQQLIKDLLEYSKAGTKDLTFKPTDCSFVVDESISNLRAAIEENGALCTHDELPTLIVDASQMSRLFQNLIGNAVKFHGEQPVRVHVSAERKRDEWVFSVQDNGIGINPQHIERIFDVFQRLHTREEYEGTGIGLAICKKIVERHDGRIWVKSEPGRGSIFYFTIPIRAASDDLSNKRRHVRVKQEIPFNFNYRGENFVASTMDISEGGLSAKIFGKPTFEIKNILELPIGDLRVKAKVKWVKSFSEHCLVGFQKLVVNM